MYMLKEIIRARLESLVKQYFKKHPEVKLVVVAGSVGKTSTKMAIATVLAEKFRVRVHEGNHNSEISAPLAILGVEFPASLRSRKDWSKAFKAAKLRIKQPTDVDVIVQELGTDRIGQIPAFGKYLKPDIAIITAVADEHMEYFQNLDNVAAEELSAANFSKLTLINRDDIDGKYAADITNPNLDTYGTSEPAEYRFNKTSFSIEEGYTGTINGLEAEPFEVNTKVYSEGVMRGVVAAAAVGLKLGMSPQEITSGVARIRPVAGRMNVLRGVKQSLIIDDTYNSSPVAVKSALDVLYDTTASQRIAVLGSMNELGATSEASHRYIGSLCDPEKLDWVVTVGDEANQYIAEEARIRGCQVRSFQTAIDAGAFVHQMIQEKAVVLFKGSQNKGFLEEAVKIILHETHEEGELVRQSEEWRLKKQDFFSKFN